MHSTVDMLDRYSNKLHSENFEKIDGVLDERDHGFTRNGSERIANLIHVVIFLNVLKKKVKEITASPEDPVGNNK